MKILDELLPGCFLIQPFVFEDARGAFVKTYHQGQCEALGISLALREEFYSVSHRGVVRGMHFQLPPHAHDKLVYCPAGAVRDVLLDLRRGPGFGKVAAVELTGRNRLQVFIPKGIAHGFMSLQDDSVMVYKTTTVHAPESDAGIRWDSFGFEWESTGPNVSQRDANHPALGDLDSPF
jgi:dTDP-4-dehydrorhamnose 3,5-epimerase/CDP-3, 6-dideoxy-D-glycero-D-glycero-4-hexulose-5-epimerase